MYQTPNTFTRSVYTSNVSSVFEMPTTPNFRNCTRHRAIEPQRLATEPAPPDARTGRLASER